MKKSYFNIFSFATVLSVLMLCYSCSRHNGVSSSCPDFKKQNKEFNLTFAKKNKKNKKHKKHQRTTPKSATATAAVEQQQPSINAIDALPILQVNEVAVITASTDDAAVQATKQYAFETTTNQLPSPTIVAPVTNSDSKVSTPALTKQEKKLLKKIQKFSDDGKISVVEKVSIAKTAKKVAKEAKEANPSKGKSQLIALILAIALGGLGIHRFYLGYTGIGVAQLLTAGGCGVWAIIDIVRIITGDLQPKDGKYTETL